MLVTHIPCPILVPGGAILVVIDFAGGAGGHAVNVSVAVWLAEG